MLSAILIPVFIVLTAMVVDVGQWYTHKRQLQTRADAGALRSRHRVRRRTGKPCVQSGDATSRRQDAARGHRERRRGSTPPIPRRPTTRPTPLPDAALQREHREPVEARRRHQLHDVHGRHRLHRRRRIAAPRATPCFIHSRRHDLAGRRPLGRRPREGERPAVALRRDRGPAHAERRARAGRDPPGAQREQVPAARRPEQRDRRRCRCGTTTNADQPRSHAARDTTTSISSRFRPRQQGASPARAAARCGACREHATPSRRATPTRLVPAHPAELRRLRPATTCRSASRCGSSSTNGRPEPVVRRADHREVRRLLHAALAVPRLQRRERRRQPRLTNVQRDSAAAGRQPPFDGYFGPLPRGARTTAATTSSADVHWGTRSDDPCERVRTTSLSRRTASTCRAPAGPPAARSPTRAAGGATDREPGREQHPDLARLGTTTTTPTPEWPPRDRAAATCGGNPCEYNAHPRTPTRRSSARPPTAGAVALVRTSHRASSSVPRSPARDVRST